MVVTEIWKPKRTATRDQAERAMALLRSGDWHLGKVWEDPNDPNVQYRAAMHPNHGGKPGEHPGVEVWERMSGPAQLPPVTTPPSTGSPEKEAVLREFEKRGFPRDEADAMVQVESGWNPASKNKQGFSGLIGFSPRFGPGPGPQYKNQWHLSKPIVQHSILEQAPLVGRYLDETVVAMGKRWRVPGDTYLTGAAPSYVGAPDATIVYKRSSDPKSPYMQNPGWRGPDGEITAGSIRAVALRQMARARRKAGEPTATPKADETESLPLPDVPTPHSSGSVSSAPPSGSSRGKLGGALAGALAGIAAALQAAINNPYVTIALVTALAMVLAVAIFFWSKRR